MASPLGEEHNFIFLSPVKGEPACRQAGDRVGGKLPGMAGMERTRRIAADGRWGDGHEGGEG